MTKIKRWVLVLSSVTIGSLRSSGFAAWKISNSIKNETSFDVDADGDVTEGGNKSYIARELGIDRTTVQKYYDEVRAELAAPAVQ